MIDEYGYVVNVDGVVVRDDEYLLIERSAAKTHAPCVLAFPGGKLEGQPGEDAIEATARRELREEVGVEVGEVTYVHSNTFEADDGSPCLNVVTRCEYLDGEAHPRAANEVAAVRWLTYDDLQRHENVAAPTARFAALVEESRQSD